MLPASDNSGIIAIMLPERENTRWQHDAETLKALAKARGYKVYSYNCCYKDQNDQNDEIEKFLKKGGKSSYHRPAGHKTTITCGRRREERRYRLLLMIASLRVRPATTTSSHLTTTR